MVGIYYQYLSAINCCPTNYSIITRKFSNNFKSVCESSEVTFKNNIQSAYCLLDYQIGRNHSDSYQPAPVNQNPIPQIRCRESGPAVTLWNICCWSAKMVRVTLVTCRDRYFRCK